MATYARADPVLDAAGEDRGQTEEEQDQHGRERQIRIAPVGKAGLEAGFEDAVDVDGAETDLDQQRADDDEPTVERFSAFHRACPPFFG